MNDYFWVTLVTYRRMIQRLVSKPWIFFITVTSRFRVKLYFVETLGLKILIRDIIFNSNLCASKCYPFVRFTRILQFEDNFLIRIIYADEILMKLFYSWNVTKYEDSKKLYIVTITLN